VNSSERGFTLIEVMVSLAVLGVIATMLASGMRLSLDLSARGTSKAEAIRTGQLGRSLLRSQLEGALPLHYWRQIEGKRVDHLAFEGSADAIRFVSRHGIQDGPGGLPRWVHVRREQASNNENRLIVEERQILSPDNQPGQTTTARVEVLSCTDVRFEYLDRIQEEKAQWLATWVAAERKGFLPLAVRVQCRTGNDLLKMLVPLDYGESAREGMWLQ
jgi:prepilin-type N-terminal cleavage/methylation domain-containing protein